MDILNFTGLAPKTCLTEVRQSLLEVVAPETQAASLLWHGQCSREGRKLQGEKFTDRIDQEPNNGKKNGRRPTRNEQQFISC